jgi:formamidopyrimidine-DNA glycosylase
VPELPEVETVRRGIAPCLVHQVITQVIIRNPRLRWPVPSDLPQILNNVKILDIQRRGKYLLFITASGTLILHLGMSGRMHLCKHPCPPPNKHDHIDIIFANHWTLRYTDPRRFGCLLWTTQPPEQHELLAQLGPEPLSRAFTGNYLYQQAQRRKIPVKSFLMDSHVVVGVGNIYANEALFKAHISPLSAAENLSKDQYQALATAVKKVLQSAIKAGGTTLNDFQNANGEAGYFSQQLAVYGREGKPCQSCHQPLIKTVIAQRSTVYCPQCQIFQS